MVNLNIRANVSHFKSYRTGTALKYKFVPFHVSGTHDVLEIKDSGRNDCFYQFIEKILKC